MIKFIYSLLYISSSVEPFKPKPTPYQFDPRIHSFGNVGPGGVVHSLFARPFTKIIDIAAYDNVNIRDKLINDIDIDKPKNIADFGCGTGTSTESIKKRFNDAIIYGVDSSKEMLRVANLFTKGINYVEENIENIMFANKQDLITTMYVFHEVPQDGRLNILENMKKNLKEDGQALIVDIDTSYKPSKMMQHGEPFIHDYMVNIDKDILSVFPKTETWIEIQNHVRVWNARM